mmetsp:Transcript_45947/g.53763  ORF Transcript_45947/g.53763 Transcript_45947/m.53763 type:complete len:272 (+) Transcript_45947:117-932(+)|eukprot:CAMPEP_0194431654 /NCGR_PEP_ID=MMETSP0176-20130528/65047_1 /TAXON_ID=216777 /ORGANISM="Proboscia alata, Strain PI-D3" /LENGTH=271 /DNA_ID=CAMNT_0039247129 /DNA_START=38 /DNA_END=853 /DNA_ORIENTATION=+
MMKKDKLKDMIDACAITSRPSLKIPVVFNLEVKDIVGNHIGSNTVNIICDDLEDENKIVLLEHQKSEDNQSTTKTSVDRSDIYEHSIIPPISMTCDDAPTVPAVKYNNANTMKMALSVEDNKEIEAMIDYNKESVFVDDGERLNEHRKKMLISRKSTLKIDNSGVDDDEQLNEQRKKMLLSRKSTLKIDNLGVDSTETSNAHFMKTQVVFKVGEGEDVVPDDKTNIACDDDSSAAPRHLQQQWKRYREKKILSKTNEKQAEYRANQKLKEI